MEKYIKHLVRNNYSRSTIQTYSSVLRLYEQDMHDVRLIKNRLKRYLDRPNTVTTHYSILHAFMKYKNDRRIKQLEEFNLPHKPNVYRPVFTKDYLNKMTYNCDQQKCYVVKFLFETGLRANEVSSIISITNETITVKGKGSKIREVFHNIDTTSKIKDFNTSTKTLRKWVKEVLGDQYTPHSIRRSHATHLLLNGANPKMVMMQLGHSKIETTYRYLQSSKELNQNIYNKHF